jgi:hypothetical protein
VSKCGVRFDDFVLQFDASSRGGFRARVLKSPFGEGVVNFSLPALAGVEPQLNTGGISRDLGHQDATGAPDVRPPLEIGTDLFRSVFQGQVLTLLDKSRGQLEISPNLGLRLKIKLDPSDEETGALADLPWELLCDGQTEDFFALSRQTSLVRYLDVPRSSQPIQFTPPLRILAVGASPYSLEPLNLEEEERRLADLNRSSSEVEVQFLGHASAGAVREALSRDTFNVLHFMGHGAFDRASGEGMLAFEGKDGAPDLVSGKAFATKLKDLRSLGVVVLNACNTARAGNQGGASPFRGVATALVLGGVPAVVAMQRPITDRAAIGFSTAFYRHLARGDSIDEALTEGRQAIHSAKPEGFEWATPVLFLRMPEGNVFVAKAAEQRGVVEPPAPVVLTNPVPPSPVPIASKRGLTLKIGTGAAGAVLVASLLYTKVLGHPSDSDRPTGTQSSGPGLTSDAQAEPSVGKSTARLPQSPTTTPREAVIKPSVSKPKNSEETSSADTQASVAPAGDLSLLSARVTSIEPQEGGLRVTVSFKNNGDRRLSVILDAENSFLSDDQGRGRYSILDSNLPMSNSNPKLVLGPGAASQNTFDFQAPQLGEKPSHLTLLTREGRHLKVSG